MLNQLTETFRFIKPGTITKCSYAFFECSYCGRISLKNVNSINSAHIKSCGCLRVLANIKHKSKHGLSKTPEYCVWKDMIKRCENPEVDSYEWYGGRGVTVCERWHSVENFIADMGLKPSKDYQIDRIDPEGNYEPGNCRWLLKVENIRRARKNLQ